MPQDGIALGDILADSGYAHRDAGAWALPLRAAGAQLICDLHPHDRGPRGTHAGAIIANGSLYCPATPKLPLHPGPLAPSAAPDDIAAHDQQTTELARHKPGKITADGYHRVACPAVMGKLRCPLRTGSMTLDRNRPEILTPPEHPPACCTQQTLTVPPDVAAKTRQKHDYPSAAHRRSYARRTSAERTFSTIKDPASNTISRGWCRLMGLTPLTLWLACLHAVRNQRILAAWNARQGREQPPGRRQPPAQNTQPPTENHPRQPHRIAITTTPHHLTAAPLTSKPSQRPATPRPRPAAPQPGAAAMHQETQDQLRPGGQATEMSEPNVNMVPTET